MKAGYLGPENSYSELAAKKMCGSAEIIAYHNFRALFASLVSGDIDVIVIPVENTINGAVTQNLDLLEETDGVFAVEQCTVPIDHRLITLKGVKPEEITRIYSHPQALEQCSKYIAKQLPNAACYPISSTSESIQMIVDKTCAGIVGSHVKAEGMQLSSQTISDEQKNYTTFLKVVKGDAQKLVLRKCSKLLFCFTLRHETGSLSKTLSALAEYGLNMTKIESRPIKNKPGEFRFFTEIESAKINAPAALQVIRAHSLSFKLLGAY